MKKLMTILLAVLMLIPLIVSCGGNDATTTTEAPTTEAPTMEAPTTEAPTTVAPTTETPTTEAPIQTWSSKNDIRDTWSGKTLNVACSVWYGTGAPWAMPEAFITEQNDAYFGKKIQNAVLDRNEFIESTYGVKVNWLNATKASMHSALEAATLAKNVNYDLAAPRMMNVQSIVAGGYVYDLADREYIDFENSYYNENAVKTFTAHGHTFFVTGGFSTIDKETIVVLYFNKNVLGDGSEKASEELYQLVRDGKWTYDKLVEYAEAAYKDDGDGERDEDDVYGASISRYNRFFNNFGITQAGVNKATGKWEITLNDEDKIDDIIDVIIDTKNADWLLPIFGWGHVDEDFINGKYIFTDRELLESYVGLRGDNVGLVPFPMLNEEQGRYYVSTSEQQTIFMCIPKLTQDREMSEYFMDVLCWTGEEYTLKAYIETKKEHFKANADMEMITDYIIPNISYDAGKTMSWYPLIDGMEYHSYDGNENKFDEIYAEKEPDALKTIAEWNAAWGGYTEE
ncbi:MAG: hypothetical protein IJ445_06865 [Clostridia bacterium]|nr:hypothetical protein [Clostridia bacterium]